MIELTKFQTSPSKIGISKGFALPIVLGVILCLGFWVASLSWTMTHTRSRFQKAVKIRRAYFLARSALQHFFLKVKLLERLCPQAMQTLYQAQGPQRTILSNSFLEDVVSPSEIGGSYPGKYSISAFSIGSISREKLEMSVEIKAKGVIDGESETIQRVYKVNR